MGSWKQWLVVLFLSAFWGFGMFALGDIRRRWHHWPSIWRNPRRDLLRGFLLLTLASLDVGLLVVFLPSRFHGLPLLVLIAVNFAFAGLMAWAFRHPLRP